MRLLNSGREQKNNLIKWFPSTVNVIKLEIKGKTFLVDTNTLSIWDVSQHTPEVVEALRIAVGTAEKPYIEQPTWNTRKGYLCFQATYACNLACRYCFVRHHYTDHENTMSYEEMLKVVEEYQPLYQQNGQPYPDGYNVGWFGGEPLMNWETIYKLTQELTKRASQAGVQAKFHITTNGTLLTEEIAEYCIEHHFSFIVSIDGRKEFHDANRTYSSGGGTFDDVMRGLRFLADAHKRKGIPSNVTLRSTFDKKGCDIQQELKFLNELMYEGLGGHVSIEPSCLAENCATAETSFEGVKLDELRALFEPEYEKAATWFVEEIKAGRKPSFHNFELPLRRFYERTPSFTECGAGCGYISVGPKGKICACHREHKSELGNMYVGGIDPTLQAQWLDNRYFSRKSCPTCWRRNACGGGCRVNSLLVGKEHITIPSLVECLFRDMQFKSTIWILSELTPMEISYYFRQPQQQSEQKQPQQQSRKKQQSTEEECHDTCKCKKQKDVNTCQYTCQTLCQYPCQLQQQSEQKQPQQQSEQKQPQQQSEQKQPQQQSEQKQPQQQSEQKQ